MDGSKVWLRPPHGGEPEEVEATPDVLIPRMIRGWAQCEPPEVKTPEVKTGEEEVDDDAS